MDVVFHFLSVTLSTLAVERTMRVFFVKRRTSFAVTVLSYLFYWATFMIHFHEIIDVFLYFSALAVITLNYESAAMKRVAAVAAGHYIVLSLTVIANGLLRHSSAPWLVDHIILVGLFINFFIYIVALSIFPLFKHIKKTPVNLNKLWFPLIIFPSAQTFMELFRYINTPIVFAIINIFNTLGFILIFFFLYNIISKVFESSLKSALHTQEREYYFTQCQLMQESIDKMKSYRHDVKLHLAALKDFTADNKAATNYLNTLIDDVEESEIYSDTGNIAFDSIINFKIKDVVANHINFQLSIFVPPTLNVEVADVVTILGNLLDNAFDAVAKVEDKMIRLTVEVNRSTLFINLNNTYDGVVKYADGKDGAANTIISRKDGDSHGYGLKNIQKSVDKYNGQMDISHEDNVFSVSILMYVEDK